MARVLLVDDEATILIVLSALFRSEGLDVVSVQGGKQAQDLLGSERFDLMVCDVRMEPVDGMQLLDLATASCKHMPVVMVTAYYSAKTAADALARGAYAFLRKPFDGSELLRVAREALEREGSGESDSGEA